MCELDTIFEALAHRRRRLALRSLQEHHVLALPDLAELVAERKRHRDLATIPDDYVKRLYMSLYHNHVPTLEDADLVRYDQERDVVRRTDRTEPSLASVQEQVDTLIHTA